METTLYIALGRFGDILAALPIIQHEIAEGRRACMMVSADYASVLDGVSVQRILWYEDWRLVGAAYRSVKDEWPKVVVLQQHSTDGWPQYHATDSYVKEMYRIGGKLPLFPLPLTFDRRDPEREARLVRCLSASLPVVLVATNGISSPFPHGGALLALLERTFPDVLIIDMDAIQGERIYDLLALFERAACLVTVDSALLHLAQATPQLPVVALVTDQPTKWHGSPQYRGQILRIPYSQYLKRTDELLQTVGACVKGALVVSVGTGTSQ